MIEDQPVVNQPIIGQPAIEPFLPKVGALLKNAWQIYRSRFWVLIWLTLIPILAMTLVPILAMTPVLFGAIGSAIVFTNTYLFISLLLYTSFIILLTALIILSLWCWLASLYAIKDRGELIGVKESLHRAWGKQILSFWWLGILEFFTLLGGLILLVAPAVVFTVWFISSSFVFVIEGQRGFNALLRSKEYVQGKWWNVFGRFLIISFLWLASYLIISGANFVISKNVADIFSAIIYILLWPFILTYLFSLYDALREARPQLAGQPVTAKKGFFVFASVLGLVIAVIVPVFILVGLSYFGLRY